MLSKDRAGFLPFARLAGNLQRVVALARSESTQSEVMHLQRSLIQLASIERYLQLRLQWNPEQVQRQRQRLERQRARLEWQQAVLEQMWDERGP